MVRALTAPGITLLPIRGRISWDRALDRLTMLLTDVLAASNKLHKSSGYVSQGDLLEFLVAVERLLTGTASIQRGLWSIFAADSQTEWIVDCRHSVPGL